MADLPARANILNVKQFNGKFGCIQCNEPGVFLNELSKRVYTPPKAAESFIEKDGAFFNKVSKLVQESNEELFGIKGTCPFTDLLDIPRQIPFDYMHLVLQGHLKSITSKFNENHLYFRMSIFLNLYKILKSCFKIEKKNVFIWA
jgi:hypothetical protein